jgi:hypothetical protein
MEWIDVNITPPPKNQEVLVYDPHAKYHSSYMAAFWDGEDFWYDENSSWSLGITHWMPLTTPPQAERL